MANTRILIVDAFNLIRRIYEAMSASDIEEVVQSCQQSLARALRQREPSHVCVVFDSHDTSWRHLLYPEYKGGRKPTPSALLDNIDRFEMAFDQLGVKSITVSGYEADDVIATLAKGTIDNVPESEVIILSTDKGFLPLLSKQLKVYNHFDNMEVTQASVRDKYGISQHQLTDYWAMAGDASNHIKGVAKVGKKSATALLVEYQNLDTILEIKEAKGPALKVQNAGEFAALCKLLVTLKTDIAIGVNLKELRYTKRTALH